MLIRLRERRAVMPKLSLLIILSVTAVAAPDAPMSALYKPTFLWKDRSVTAGRGFLASFAVQNRSTVLFISCFHVLGDQPEGVLGLAAVSAEEKPRLVLSSRYLKTPGQAVLSQTSLQGELTVFEIDRVPRGTARFQLSERLPQENEDVYLFAQAYGENSPRLYRAKVRSAQLTYIDYVFDDPGIELGSTSGGPILDEQGLVIGINGGGKVLDGELHGYANPIAGVRATIEGVLTPAKNQSVR